MYGITGGLLLLTGILLVIVWRYVKRPRLPPGPTGLPFLGNSHQIDAARPHLQLTEWAGLYKDFYKIRLHAKPIIVLCSSELIRHAAVTNSEAFAGRPSCTSKTLEKALPFCLTRCDLSGHWSRMKRAVGNALKMHGEGLGHLEDVTMEEAQTLLEEFSSRKGQPCDPWDDLQRAMAIIIFNMTFGSRLSRQQADALIALEKKVHDTASPEEQVLEPDTAQWMGFSSRPSMARRHCSLHDAIQEAYQQPIKDRKIHVFQERFEADQVGCVADALLMHNIYSSVEHMLCDDDICAILRDLNEAAVAPTTTTLYSLLGLMVEHPECQEHLQEVIDNEVGSRPPCVSDRRRMPYVEAVVLEALRYTSQFPLGLPHKTNKVVNMNGYVIPKGTQVIFNLWSLHHDERYWEDPWHFHPERFLTAEGGLISHEHPSRRRLLMFGAGRRACVGEMVAKNRLFLLLTTILQRFTLLPADDNQPINMDPHFFQDAGIGIRPQHFKIRFIQRETIQSNL